MDTDKFISFIHSNHYRIERIYTSSLFSMIEIYSNTNLNGILLHIPSKYSFSFPSTYDQIHLTLASPPKDMNEMVIPISLVEDTYYSNFNVSDNTYHLDRLYNTNISFDDNETRLLTTQKQVLKQLHRLKYCISTISHKLALIDQNVAGVINNKDQIELYTSSSHVLPKKLYLIIDIKCFFENVQRVEYECSEIYKGIYGVLDSTSKKHATNIQQVIDKHRSTILDTGGVQNLKTQYSQLIQKYSTMLDQLKTYTCTSDEEKCEIQGYTNQIVDAIVKLTAMHEKLLLDIDNIYFDNIVLLDKLLKNLGVLQQLNAS